VPTEGEGVPLSSFEHDGGARVASALVRRSDRISLAVPIQVAGTDAFGQDFKDDCRTIIVSRYGAKIALCRDVPAQEEVQVNCLSTGISAGARIVGLISSGDGVWHYGLEFLDPQVNVWGIEFPPLSESENAVARALLECGHCHAQELVYLGEFEAEVFEANKCLSRRCNRCTDTTVWKVASAEACDGESPSTAQPAVGPDSRSKAGLRTENERHTVRVSLKMAACIRSRQHGEEVVTTENVSRGGLRFRSPKRYAVGAEVEVAVPYSPGGCNIFAPARVQNAVPSVAGGPTAYGLSYIPVHKGWPTG